MQNAMVMWFDNSRGYGFMRDEQSRAVVFVHRKAIQKDYKFRRSLITNQRVTYQPVITAHGLSASEVVTAEAP